ncbi:hypothetical protein [Roseivirga misakiensis]|uniref:Uncharacterized protein n=1 Tax=Roseivirga misakiensis TaxID=1563681 RepID=A0A1E5T127_9BACT|nr:hypothetical protein [Roseivirga misakiensis]OEK05083.1 hypothetical protein BFP71_16835 [Roseivirga misakiensis]
MDSRRAELLEKYWEAEASLEDEKELKALIKAEQESEEVEEVKALFDHFESESKIELDESFDESILQMISEEPETKVFNLQAYFKRYASIAAAVVVIFVSGYLANQQQNQYVSEDTFETPEEAYAELKRQLLMVSNYMNKGNQTMNELTNLGKVGTELQDFSRMSEASEGLELLSEMNLKNN